MAEQSTAASHALAHGAVELARLVGPFSFGAAVRAGAVRRPTSQPSAESLRDKAFSFGDAGAVRPDAVAEIDTWEEF